VFAAVALADRLPDQGNAILSEVVQKWWRSKLVLPRDQRYALYEMLHVLRDNVKIDLRESAAGYFKDLPLAYLTGHYPAPFAAPDNEFLIPVYLHEGNPDPADAAMSRAAGLAMVAYDTNALDSQLLQGWLMRDRFTMRGSLGAVYEFLWANPFLWFFSSPTPVNCSRAPAGMRMPRGSAILRDACNSSRTASFRPCGRARR
jgi:hypothetical protein